MTFKGIKCPSCKKKGLQHPSLWGRGRDFLDYEKVICRYCKAYWKTETLEAYLKKIGESK